MLFACFRVGVELWSVFGHQVDFPWSLEACFFSRFFSVLAFGHESGCFSRWFSIGEIIFHVPVWGCKASHFCNFSWRLQRLNHARLSGICALFSGSFSAFRVPRFLKISCAIWTASRAIFSKLSSFRISKFFSYRCVFERVNFVWMARRRVLRSAQLFAFESGEVSNLYWRSSLLLFGAFKHRSF